MATTENDMRMLRAIDRVCRHFDGCMPHGTAEWTAVRRLMRSGLAEGIGDGSCQTCPDPHEGMVFRLTDAGRAALAAAEAPVATRLADYDGGAVCTRCNGSRAVDGDPCVCAGGGL